MPSEQRPEMASTPPEPIAVIGMSCRLSGEASSVDGFWDMLRNGRTGHCRVPSSRYEASAWYHPNQDRKGGINHDSGFFLEEDPSRFDAPFFSITAKEAAGMDPTQRLLLEVAYETFENSGVPLDFLPGSRTGVFTGCMTNDYELLSTGDIYNMPHNSATGNARAMLANRLSWFFDLRGPSIMLDTACSSSLTALHLACKSLRDGECDMALVSGANLILHPNFTQRLSYMHMLSPDGVSHSFDESANGYGRGEGFAAVILKPLSAALANNDAIRAVIRATGINQDGRTPGITMPSRQAQADLISTLYGPGLPSIEETAFFEAHGTGTKVGDPTELAAIGECLMGAKSVTDDPLYVGSVKGNIGHTEGAAGVASLIKVVLCLEKGMLVPNAGFSKLNPRIHLDNWLLQLSDKSIPWPSHLPRRASINSFGFGGSNAHSIVESASTYLKCSVPQSNGLELTGLVRTVPQVVVFSTHDKTGIDRVAMKWGPFLQKQIDSDQNISIRDIAYTMCARRSQLPFRSFAVAGSLGELRDAFQQGLPHFLRANGTANANLAFVFTGQGAQWAQMGLELFRITSFKDSITRSEQILSDLGCDWHLTDEIQAEAATSRMNQPDRSQSICCALQIALVDLMASWRVHPKATVGHSSGEIGAAYAAGFITHENAIRIAYFRGLCSLKVFREGRVGAMLAVSLSASDAQTYLKVVPPGSVVVACVNGPTSVTLSGDADRIDQLEKQLQLDGFFARKLRVETAYHSRHMDMVAGDYRKALLEIQPTKCRESSIAMFSSVTKERVYATDMTADYWVRNLVSPVEFLSAVTSLATMTEDGQSRRRALKWSAFIEIGPHDALKGPFIQVMKSLNDSLSTVPYQALVRRQTDAVQTALNVAGSLWCIGIPIDMEAVNASISSTSPRLLCNLPSYPWNHRNSFWHEPVASARLRKRKEPHHDLLGAPMNYQNEMEPRWRNFLRLSDIPWLADHVVADSILFPAAGMVVMVAESARTLASPSQHLEGIEFNDLAFLQGLVIPDDDRGLEIALHVAPYREVPEWYEFTIFSLPVGGPGTWVRHATGTFTLHYDDLGVPLNAEDWDQSVERFRKAQTAVRKVNCDAVYEWLSQTGGVTMGPAFQSITRVVFCEGSRLLVEGQVTDTKAMMPCEYESPYFIHPTSLDTLFQAAVLSCSDALGNQNAKIPVGVDRLYLSTTWSLRHGDRFSVSTESCLHNGDSRLISMASDISWSQPRVLLQGVRLGLVPVSKLPSANTAIGGKSGTSRFSSISWAQHMQSSTPLALLGQDRHDQLTGWIQNICYIHGDASALVITQSDWESPVMTSIQSVMPQLGSRPCLQRLTIVIVGDDKAAKQFAATVSSLMPGTQVKQIAALRDFGPATVSESLFDAVLIDQPCLSKAADADTLLTSLSLTTKPDGVLAIRAHDIQLESMDYIQRSSRWATGGVLQDRNFVLAHRQMISVPIDSDVFVLLPDTEHIPTTFKIALERTFSTVGVRLYPIGLQDIDGLDLAGRTIISLLEFRHPWISTWTSAAMSQFKMLLEAKYILWVSPIPSCLENASAATFGASTGVLRTLRNERPNVTLPQVQYEPIDSPNEHLLAQTILQVIQLTLSPATDRYHDLEYRLQNGRLMVPRVVSEDLVDDRMRALLYGPQPTLSRLADDPRALRFQTGPTAGHGQWVEDRNLMCDIPAGYLEVQLTMRSIVVSGSRNSNASESPLSVVEAVGVVRKVGGAGHTDLSVGDVVLLLVPAVGTMSGMSNRMQVPSTAVAKLPAQLALAQAVTIPLAYTLAYASLFDIARLGPDSTVLLVGPVGHTLSALLNCALEVPGMHVYVATEGHAAAEELAAQYSIAPGRALNIHGGLDTRIADLTGGKGVAAVLSCFGGSIGRLATRCLAAGGHFVDLTNDMDLAALPKSVVSQGCTFTSINLSSMLQKQSKEFYSLFRRAVATIGSHHQLQPTTIFPLAKWADAEALARQTEAPVAIDLSDSSQVPVVPALDEPVTLNPQHTFLLAGGLGMIGLGFAQTLVDSGARQLVILSRSGVLQDSQKLKIASLQDQGCHVEIVRCDISQEADLQRVLSQIRSKQWQLKGIIQCATVLKDAMFHAMSFEDWASSTNPKILGTLNLHRVFIDVPLDFFITLSSVSGLIGNIGQANYAAGNVFMDELMIWRHAHGLPGHSIDIGLVPDASGMSDLDETAEMRRSRYSHLKGTEITLRELQMLLRIIIERHVPLPVQIIAGITDDLPREAAASWQYDRKLDHRVRLDLSEPDNMPAQISELLKGSHNLEEASSVVNQALREYLASAMTTTADTIDPDLPLSSLGVDSLKVTEVQHWVSRKMGAQLSSFDFLGMQPLKVLSEKIATQSAFVTVS